MQHRVYTAWAIVQPAPDLPGQWVAHCLEFDVVSQGNSMMEALEMVFEATQAVICDDLNDGRDPIVARNTAPDEYRRLLKEILRDGEGAPLSDILAASANGEVAEAAIQLYMEFQRNVAVPKSESLISYSLPRRGPTSSGPIEICV
jgi:predicted RNase H-like HicB family nuclease